MHKTSGYGSLFKNMEQESINSKMVHFKETRVLKLSAKISFLQSSPKPFIVLKTAFVSTFYS